MGENSKIEWTDHSFNYWEGCNKVSPGCANCYAESLNKRFHGGENWGPGAPRLLRSEAYRKLPLKWNREAGLMAGEAAVEGFTHIRPRVFCSSLADWLDDEVPIEWLAGLLKLIQATPNLDWLLLTKRPENWHGRIGEASEYLYFQNDHEGHAWIDNWTGFNQSPRNVWIGTSVENQKWADKRIPDLLKIPARVHFLSCEPLLGPVDLGMNARGLVEDDDGAPYPGTIDWVIVGGESGPGARKCNVRWIQEIRDQCKVADVPCFIKQLGAEPYWGWPRLTQGLRVRADDHLMLKFADKKGGDWSEWPEDLRIREFPEVK